MDSGGTVLATTVAWNPDSNSQLVWHGSAGWLTDPAPGYEFDLGLTSGPRAFGVHSFTGNRAFFTTAEARRLIWPNVFGVVSLGVAAYVDYGGAWWSGSPERTGTDVGLGLRIAQSRSSQGIVSPGGPLVALRERRRRVRVGRLARPRLRLQPQRAAAGPLTLSHRRAPAYLPVVPFALESS